MDEISPDLEQACIDLVQILLKLNDTQRREMREIHLARKTDLSDSMVVAEKFMLGIHRSERESVILDQMYKASSRLQTLTTNSRSVRLSINCTIALTCGSRWLREVSR